MPLPLLLIPAASLAASAISSTTASTALLAAAGATSTAVSSTTVFFSLGSTAAVTLVGVGSYFSFFGRGTRAENSNPHKVSLVSSDTREQIAAVGASVDSFKIEVPIIIEKAKAGLKSTGEAVESLQGSTTAISLVSTDLRTGIEEAGIMPLLFQTIKFSI